MTKKQFFSGRIPQELLEHIENHIKVTGETKTQLLINSLAQYTHFDTDNTKTKGTTPKIVHDIEEVKNTLKSLTERIEKLELSETTKIENKQNNKEKLPLFTCEEITEGIYTYKDVIKKLNISDNTLKKRYEKGVGFKSLGMTWTPMKEKGVRRFKVKKITDDNK